MTINTELKHGISLLAERFPNKFGIAEDRMTIHAGKVAREFRLSVVLGETTDDVYAGTADTAEAAFAILMKDFNKPKTEAIQKARELLEKEGFTVAPVS